jgi:hypothetical protein
MSAYNLLLCAFNCMSCRGSANHEYLSCGCLETLRSTMAIVVQGMYAGQHERETMVIVLLMIVLRHKAFACGRGLTAQQIDLWNSILATSPNNC